MVGQICDATSGVVDGSGGRPTPTTTTCVGSLAAAERSTAASRRPSGLVHAPTRAADRALAIAPLEQAWR